MLNFRLLGPLEIRAGVRTARVRGALQSRLLLALLVNAGQLVITDDLIGEIWPARPPNQVENALQAHVSRLRRKLEELEPDAVRPRLVTHMSGYQLLLDPDELDGLVFARELERIREERSSPATAVQELRSCLALCYGPLLGGAVGGPMCETARTRYGELYVSALELLYDLELASGQHARLVPELRALLAKYPFHERFWQQLMAALYRSGRQTEALTVYRQLWSRLTDELGLEPTPAMREYERAILERDTRMDLSSVALG